MCCVAQESLEEASSKKKYKEVVAEKDVQVVAEEKLEKINLRSDSQEPRPILISSRLLEKEKSELILLLKEYKDVFTWNYSEMTRLDLGLVMHTLNMDLETRPVAQPARIFHTEIEGQIVNEVHKLLAAEFIKPIQHSC